MVHTREPNARRAGRFGLIRDKAGCAWALRDDVPDDVAAEVEKLACEEPPIRNPFDTPLHAEKYLALLGGKSGAGPEFTFPDRIEVDGDVARVSALPMLERHFRGWTADEIPEREPIMAMMDGGYAVSVCFCARLSDEAAEAGVETASAFRGRGFAPRVTAAWAAAIRASGRVPLYSTAWTNIESRAVARKLGLILRAVTWGIGD